MSNLDIRSVLRLRAIFGWIAFAKRPIRKAELQSALMFQPGESMGERPVPAHILDACKPLVEERRNSTLAFIHTSVREYVTHGSSRGRSKIIKMEVINTKTSYLQSSDCNQSVWLDRESIRWDQGLASLLCVRSAFNTFTPNLPHHDRQAQVIRGVWGFLPFATELWAIHLQHMAAVPTEARHAERHAQLSSTASDLSAVLVSFESQLGPNAACSLALSKQQMEELEPIRSQFPILWYDVALRLQARCFGGHRVDSGCQSDSTGG